MEPGSALLSAFIQGVARQVHDALWQGQAPFEKASPDRKPLILGGPLCPSMLCLQTATPGY